MNDSSKFEKLTDLVGCFTTSLSGELYVNFILIISRNMRKILSSVATLFSQAVFG